ncbi:nuclear transport factor 2 family protein [Flavobacterium wongokense]|uniref:nuclear transport factor 2 family protein n=1 Tax=Flavobacterium wongokense TaxID=2910674 RepID=UPI001F23A2E9|nr:nuclear transport factor 2 family protein [Flavobacterium sp. WG47]MCF6132523.1 nuclear transport factor 2 family protein [Flavobacterium sp. WG47]
MEQIKQHLEELNTMVLQGNALDAFKKFYHENVVMQENQNEPTVGKSQNWERELEFFSNVTEFRDAALLEMAVNGNVSFTIWHYDYTHKDWGVRNYQQVAVQHWENGLIVKEQFFYGS